MVEKLLNKISSKLEDIPGIIGIVLGGSRAREPIMKSPT